MKGRFQPTTVGNMASDPNGGYVCYEDYEQLHAKLDALRKQEPMAWFINVNKNTGQPTRYEQCAEMYNGTEDTVPLYAQAPPAIRIGKSDSIHDLTLNIVADCGCSIEHQDLFNKIGARLWDYFDNNRT